MCVLLHVEFCDFCKWYTGGGGAFGKNKILFQIEWQHTHTHTHTPRIATVISDKLTEKSACLPNFDYSFHISQMCVYVRARKFAIVCVFSFSVF